MNNSLSVVIPVYNEENNVNNTIESLINVLCNEIDDYQVVIVDDGSRDRSLEIANLAARKYSRIKVISHKQNMGPGMALLTGYQNCEKDYLTYIPADGQFSPAELIGMLKAGKDAEIVVSYRSSRQDYSFYRLMNSFVYLALNRILFGLNFKDINWVHLYDRRIFEKIKVKSHGVFLLGEILAKAKHVGFRIRQIPTAYYPRKCGKAKGGSPKAVLTALKEMFSLWWHMTIIKDERL